jgi:hypothetical protein
VVKWTAEHGERFMLGGGLTMADQSRDYFLQVMDGLSHSKLRTRLTIGR